MMADSRKQRSARRLLLWLSSVWEELSHKFPLSIENKYFLFVIKINEVLKITAES